MHCKDAMQMNQRATPVGPAPAFQLHHSRKEKQELHISELCRLLSSTLFTSQKGEFQHLFLNMLSVEFLKHTGSGRAIGKILLGDRDAKQPPKGKLYCLNFRGVSA